MQKFCECYLGESCFNQTQAYIDAGYKATSRRVASAEAVRLLRKPAIQAELARIQAETREKTGITKQRIIDELATIGFSKITDFVDWDDEVRLKDSQVIKPDAIGAIAEVNETPSKPGARPSIKLRLHNKIDALTQLSRLHGYDAPVKTEHTGKDGGPIVTKQEGPDLSGYTTEELLEMQAIHERANARRDSDRTSEP
jgi:phage terminase small subunit